MKNLIIVEIDPVGIVLNRTTIPVDPSSKLDGTLKKSRFYLTNDEGKILGKMFVFGDDEKIDSVEFVKYEKT